MLEGLGALAGSALGRVGDALDTPRRLLWQGAGSIYNAVTGNDDPTPQNGGELLSNLGMDKDSYFTKALGMGVDMATDPLTFAGGLIGRGVGAAAEAADRALNPGVASLLKGRRGFQAVKGVEQGADGMLSARIVGAMPEAVESRAIAAPEWLDRGIAKNVGKITGPMPEAYGTFDPNLRATFTPAGADAATMRHEIMHGFGQQAALGTEGMPLSARLASYKYRNPDSFLGGIASIADETGARMAEQRGTLSQLLAGGKFLMNPNPGYVKQAAQYSPTAATLWQALQGAGKAAPYAAGGAGAYYAGQNLLGGR